MSFLVSNPHRVLTNLAKWKSLSFPGFPDPQNGYFQRIIKRKPDVTNKLSSHFGRFLAEVQNILFKEHGDWLHPRQSLCHPANLCYCYWQLCTKLDAHNHTFQNSLNKFKIPWVFQSCKHPATASKHWRQQNSYSTKYRKHCPHSVVSVNNMIKQISNPCVSQLAEQYLLF